jgi:uracil-DNA glycosylase
MPGRIAGSALNPVLTVEVGRAGSHEQCGWQALTLQIVQALCRVPRQPVFLLWGGRRNLSSPGRCRRLLAARPDDPSPSYDFQRRFMAAPDSHFLATQDLVDWWALSE